MANAVDHAEIRRLPIKDRFYAMDEHASIEHAMLADLFGRDAKSLRVRAILDERDLTEADFARDCKEWGRIESASENRSDPFTVQPVVELQEGYGDVIVYVIDISGYRSVRATERSFPAVYDRVEKQYIEKVFNDAYKDLKKEHRAIHKLMALYGVYGFRSRFSHMASYGTEEHRAEQEETAAAAQSATRESLSAFGPAGSMAPRDPEPESDASDGEYEGD